MALEEVGRPQAAMPQFEDKCRNTPTESGGGATREVTSTRYRCCVDWQQVCRRQAFT
jgi:hypothetical protein